MIHQLREGEGREKRQKPISKAKLPEPNLTDDSAIGDEIDPADFFDPEEFDVYRRDPKSSRP
jgi:hypothetical protein